MSEDYVGVRGYSKPSPEEQRSLIERMKAGDREAREQFVRSNMGLVFRVAGKYCSPQNRDDAIQEGAIKVWKLAEQYDAAKGEFSTLAIVSIKRKFKDIAKSERRRPMDFVDPSSVEFDNNAVAYDNFEDKTVYDRLREEVQKLPLYERAVLTFHFGLYDTPALPLREVAKNLNMSHEMVRRHEKKAIMTLQKRLQQSA